MWGGQKAEDPTSSRESCSSETGWAETVGLTGAGGREGREAGTPGWLLSTTPAPCWHTSDSVGIAHTSAGMFLNMRALPKCLYAGHGAVTTYQISF